MPVRLAEWSFRFEPAGIDQSLDHDFGVGRHEQIHGLATHHPNRRPSQAACHRHLIDVVRQLLDRGVAHGGRTAEHNGALEWPAQGFGLAPVDQQAWAQLLGHVHTHATTALEMLAIVADIGDARFWIAGDHVAGGDVGSDVPTGGGDRHGQAIESPERLL